MSRVIYITLLALVILSCGSRRESQKDAFRNFPSVNVPAIVTDHGQRLEYSLEHYWDGFFAGDGLTDSSAVLGVKKADLEQALASYLQLVSFVPKAEGQEAIGNLFRSIEEKQAADTAGHVYLLMTEMVSLYLYDPNSPFRDEDLYLPFVRGMIESPFTREEVLPGYVFEEKMCSLNQYGTVAADFEFKEISGRIRNLHGIKAEYTIIFFSNPGCEACRDFMLTLNGSEKLASFVKEGKVAVLNIYIDRELDKWREYVHNYPSFWTNAYDCKFIIRDEALYNARAIPSIYLLDRDKKVLLKDTPPEKVLEFIENSNIQ